jgi:hypothetical protein
MAKKDNSTLFLLAAVAIAGYLAFRQGGFLNKAAVPASPPQTSLPMVPFNPAGIATEQPTPDVINVYSPTLDPTGQSLNLF